MIRRSDRAVYVENFIAFDLDRLFRTSAVPTPMSTIPAPRQLASSPPPPVIAACSRRIEVIWFGMSSQTGVAQPDAERRVDEVAARAKENIARARRSVAVIAFAAGAGTLLGAAASWFAACAGGRVRDGEATPHALWDWRRPVRRT
jgi:hypothetical protein